jgi:hypothetical protein
VIAGRSDRAGWSDSGGLVGKIILFCPLIHPIQSRFTLPTASLIPQGSLHLVFHVKKGDHFTGPESAGGRAGG